ncbi:hypothetical protein BpHYR1_049136 [Brachionus plicatilis]|uniref:Uncharacterized protein n=1 Tax=Brachionus plicatilis TaxID=10195 RepID=A0A3M7SKI3_BRAPC|nr:hypothetical protein BpHYR1_049136 [Brachionus plicatilis]
MLSTVERDQNQHFDGKLKFEIKIKRSKCKFNYLTCHTKQFTLKNEKINHSDVDEKGKKLTD